jgi:hypothetical protein
MSVLFKELVAGAPIYALVKGDELKYHEGYIVTVGQQRMEMPQVGSQQMPMQMPQIKNVVDVTYSIDGKNYTDAVDVAASVFQTDKTGAIALVATDTEAIVRELHATQKSAENYISEAEVNLPKKEKQVKECKSWIAQLDTKYREKQETEERFAKIEESQRELGGKLDKILEKLEKA